MDKNEKKRGWVKNTAIIFLAVMLVLTFFSNTIMNWSLPEVTGQYAGFGTITTSIRGTGTVEANMAFDVQLEETRDIKTVLIAEGDTVEAGEPLFELEDADSEELEQAKDKLDTLEYNYKINQLQSGSSDYTQTENDIADLEEDLEAAKAQREGLEEYWVVYEQAQAETEAAEEKADSLSEEAGEIQDLLTELAGGKDGDSEDVAAKLEELSKAQEKYDSVEEEYELTQEAYNDIKAEMPMTLEEAQDAVSSAQRLYNSYMQKEDSAESAYRITQAQFNDGLATATALASAENTLHAAMSDTYYQSLELKEAKAKLEDIEKLDVKLTAAEDKMDKAKLVVKECQTAVNSAQKELDKAVTAREKELKALQDEKNTELKEANSLLKAAKKAETAASENCDVTVKQADENIQSLERQLKTSQLTLSGKKRTDTVNTKVTKLELEQDGKEIEKQKALIEELESKSVGTEVTAKYAGIISTVNCVAGDTVSAGKTLCQINVDGKGFTVSISVTNEQSRQVHIGDTAAVTNNWWSETEAVLAAIKPDFTNPGKNKILEFTVTGDITEGQSLSLVAGERESSYNLVVPNSAVREDSEGTFILVARAKSTPLGNRYIATRVDVTVLARDSYNSALDAGTDFGFEYVITTSSKPLDAGMQVRLANTE